jgi:hypothetical protein
MSIVEGCGELLHSVVLVFVPRFILPVGEREPSTYMKLHGKLYVVVKAIEKTCR